MHLIHHNSRVCMNKHIWRLYFVMGFCSYTYSSQVSLSSDKFFLKATETAKVSIIFPTPRTTELQESQISVQGGTIQSSSFNIKTALSSYEFTFVPILNTQIGVKF